MNDVVNMIYNTHKKIFIIVTQSVIIKNILRSGGFELFKKSGYHMVIFLRCKKVPDYIQKEFAGKYVRIVPVGDDAFSISKTHRIFIKLASYFFWNTTTKRYFRYDRVVRHGVSKTRAFFDIPLLRAVSFTMRIFPFLRNWFRKIDKQLFSEKTETTARYFDIYKPDIVFSTSITSKVDTAFMKEARRRGVTTVSMPKTWDTVTRTYFHFVPDYFLAQNEILVENLVSLQDFPREKIYLIGFPEFDWYARKDIVRSREEHLTRLGLDPAKPVIFFGSQGKWFPNDYTIAELIYKWIQNDELIKPCQMIVRPYVLLLDEKENPFLMFKEKKGVVYDNTHYPSPDLPDQWDPVVPTIVDFVNTLTHSDILVVVLSTLALDGACHDKPVINALFNSLYMDGKDITGTLASTTHYEWIFDTGGTSLAWTPEELKERINAYLENPDIKKREQKILREKLCYKIDGKSSERMVKAIDTILHKSVVAKNVRQNGLS